MNRAVYGATLVLVFALAAGARLYRLNAAPGGFHPDRQYNTMLLARAFFCAGNPAVPEWKRQVAEANRLVVIHNELPLTEWVSGKLFRALGSECFWVPRLIGAGAWLAGGVFLLLIARRFLPDEAAAVSAAFFLLMPFGILLSRSLQPDSLMVMGLLAAMWAICRYHEAPSAARLLAGGAVSGVAILLKPGVSQFVILGVFVFMSARRLGWRGTFCGSGVWVFTALAALPSALQLAHSLWSGQHLLTVFRQNFVPKLLVTEYFWRGWAGTLSDVFGVTPLLLGGLGLVILLGGRGSAAAWGWVTGYLAQCLLSTGPTSSHDYYHAQVIPLVALGVGCATGPVWRVVSESKNLLVRGLALPAVIAASFLLSLKGAEWTRDRADRADIRMWEEIGESVEHSPRTVFLDYCYGRPLCYFGWVSGRWWPQTHNLEYDAYLYGVERTPAGERFRRDYAAREAEFFIVRNLPDYERQPDLKEFLESRFPVRSRTGRYIIYDLRTPVR